MLVNSNENNNSDHQGYGHYQIQDDWTPTELGILKVEMNNFAGNMAAQLYNLFLGVQDLEQ